MWGATRLIGTLFSGTAGIVVAFATLPPRSLWRCGYRHRTHPVIGALKPASKRGTREEKMRAILAACAATQLLTACVSTQAPRTASGRPEVTIPNAPPAAVKSALLNRVIDRGYRLVKDEQFSLTVEKPVENVAAVLLLGTGMGPPVARLGLTVAEIDGNTRVVADMSLIQNSGTAFERRTDVSRGADSAQVQTMLEDVAAQVTLVRPASKKVARSG